MRRSERGGSLWGPLIALALLGGALWWFLAGGPSYDVVLYCGVDQDQSRPMAEKAAKSLGYAIDYHGETEAFRSIGLSTRLANEADAPKADVYWSNEIMHMVHLSESGVIDPLPDGVLDSFPEQWRAANGRFIQFGARARVLLVNTELLPDPKDHPTSYKDLLDPKYKAMGLSTSMARPLTGTTYTHAVVDLTNNTEQAKAFFKSVAQAERDGAMKVVKSNGQVMRVVSDKANKVAFGLTDTDDAWIAIQAGAPVVIIYPDQADDEQGAILIPNTAGLVKGRPHPEAAEKLLRWLASKDTEAQLAAGPSAQIPLRSDVAVPADGHVKLPGKDFRAAAINWVTVGANIDRWRDWLSALFRNPNAK